MKKKLNIECISQLFANEKIYNAYYILSLMTNNSTIQNLVIGITY